MTDSTTILPLRPAALPPKWALGYMQSHRTLETDVQMMGIIDTFRTNRIPLDAVSYLGTGFTPRGWTTMDFTSTSSSSGEARIGLNSST